MRIDRVTVSAFTVVAMPRAIDGPSDSSERDSDAKRDRPAQRRRPRYC